MGYRLPGFSVHGILRPEYWSGWPFFSPRDLPNPGIKPGSPTLEADSLPSGPPGKSGIHHKTDRQRSLPKWNLISVGKGVEEEGTIGKESVLLWVWRWVKVKWDWGQRAKEQEQTVVLNRVHIVDLTEKVIFKQSLKGDEVPRHVQEVVRKPVWEGRLWEMKLGRR